MNKQLTKKNQVIEKKENEKALLLIKKLKNFGMEEEEILNLLKQNYYSSNISKY